MKKNFKATDYMKSEVNIAFVINFWESHRCADGYENLFDLVDETDFANFVNLYGQTTANEYKKVCRYWFGGQNFIRPIPKNEEDLYKIVDDVYDIEFFNELYKQGYKEIVQDWFFMDDIIKCIGYRVFVVITTSIYDIKSVNAEIHTININEQDSVDDWYMGIEYLVKDNDILPNKEMVETLAVGDMLECETKGKYLMRLA